MSRNLTKVQFLAKLTAFIEQLKREANLSPDIPVIPEITTKVREVKPVERYPDKHYPAPGLTRTSPPVDKEKREEAIERFFKTATYLELK
jgi:hypothetical protein